jgi:hypothetical protein
MNNNGFKELEELYIKERGNAGEQTKHNIGSNINLFGFVSNIIDLYIPKAGDVIKSISSFSSKRDDNNI